MFTSVEWEEGSETREVVCVGNTRGDQASSGLILAATEKPQLSIHYIPQLGHAPRWASFLDNLTEELEESKEVGIYDDYKFVTAAELEKWVFGYFSLVTCSTKNLHHRMLTMVGTRWSTSFVCRVCVHVFSLLVCVL